MGMHIFRSKPCLEYYKSKGWAIPTTSLDKLGYHYNFCHSIYSKEENRQRGTQPRLADEDLYEPEPLGIRVSKPHDFHQSINDQTIYFDVQPIQKSLLERFTTSDNDSDVEYEFEDDNDSDVEYEFEEEANEEIEEQAEESAPHIGMDNSVPLEDEQETTPGQKEEDVATARQASFVFDSTKLPTPLAPTPLEKAEIGLMNLMTQHKLSLESFNSIWNWAHTNEKEGNFSFASYDKPRKRETMMKGMCVNLGQTEIDDFEPKLITWLPYNKQFEVYVRDFKVALASLLGNEDLIKQENFSFPNRKVPYIWKDFKGPKPNSRISELHHGEWWVKSWKERCALKEKSLHLDDSEVKEILVPVILYMDGIAIDRSGRLKLEPLNMTLGIFNTETRKRPDAWETLYFHPDPNVVQIAQSAKKASATEGVQNLHAGLKVALQSFFDLCQRTDGYMWKGLPYGGKIWNVRMKFAIAYVIGDTELHDQLCGRYKVYNTKIKKLCRHCNISTQNLVNPAEQYEARLWRPKDFAPTGGRDKKYFQSISHHNIENAFDRLDFGCNVHKIHLATPGELLHMHQLGCAKRAVEAFVRLIGPREKEKKIGKKKKGGEEEEGKKTIENPDGGESDDTFQSHDSDLSGTDNSDIDVPNKSRKRPKGKGYRSQVDGGKKKNKVLGNRREKSTETQHKKNGKRAKENFGLLAQAYGAILTRQSDRNFPRTRFGSTHILNTKMKEGNHFAGILLCILTSLVSTLGKVNIRSYIPELRNDRVLIGQIETIEMILGMEEFLKYGGIKVGEIPKRTSRLSEGG